MNNPFELTFGLKPSNYISRLKQSDKIILNFKSRTGNKSLLINGVRGTVKTVMLSHISKQFENDKNWIVIELIPNYDMLEQFASVLYDSSIMNKIFNKIVSPEYGKLLLKLPRFCEFFRKTNIVSRIFCIWFEYNYLMICH